MIEHENRLLARNIIPYFFRKLGKISQNVSSAAVVTGTLRVNIHVLTSFWFEQDLVAKTENRFFRVRAPYVHYNLG